jgi:3-methyladenine DNA glycosylase/8-oxoguanine DNA glycosylase
VARIVTQQRRGTGDPTFRVEASGALRRGLRTPVGTAALKITVESTEVVGTAWGDGAEWALDALPALCGALDDPSGFTPHHEAVAQGWRRHPHLRLGRTGLVMEALVPSILEQKVTGKQAFGAFRQLVTRHGERAPGPYADLFVQPSPQAIAQIPSWEWLKLQVDPVRSKTLVGACRRAVALERVAVLEDAEEVDRRLRSLPGIGVWTAAEVRQRALGTPTRSVSGTTTWPTTWAGHCSATTSTTPDWPRCWSVIGLSAGVRPRWQCWGDRLGRGEVHG